MQVGCRLMAEEKMAKFMRTGHMHEARWTRDVHDDARPTIADEGTEQFVERLKHYGDASVLRDFYGIDSRIAIRDAALRIDLAQDFRCAPCCIEQSSPERHYLPRRVVIEELRR
ncbi:hypothetical protein WJ91_17795 [Burkholderia ubonensis]|nr:hypothetical protein WJ91_17795 [Burkholderia ubonensis]